ncbi:hypothetical protein IWQ61_002548 [Dispira simplex]|nr:hypothetical protein IWQ61_002548 [Dispira simplex]
MAPTLITIFALVALASFATAELPSDVKDCLGKCPSNSDPNACVAECTGVSKDALAKYQKCGEGCLNGDMSDTSKVMDCTNSCVSDFQEVLDYPIKDVIAATTDESTAEAINAMLESSGNSTSSDESEKDTGSDSKDNGASTVATFTSSFGLCAAVIAYQLA